MTRPQIFLDDDVLRLVGHEGPLPGAPIGQDFPSHAPPGDRLVALVAAEFVFVSCCGRPAPRAVPAWALAAGKVCEANLDLRFRLDSNNVLHNWLR